MTTKNRNPRPDYDEHAQALAHQSLDGDVGDEAYRLRLATVAQVYAALAVADALEHLGHLLREYR